MFWGEPLQNEEIYFWLELRNESKKT